MVFMVLMVIMIMVILMVMVVIMRNSVSRHHPTALASRLTPAVGYLGRVCVCVCVCVSDRVDVSIAR
jgi:hypothetical protein